MGGAVMDFEFTKQYGQTDRQTNRLIILFTLYVI